MREIAQNYLDFLIMVGNGKQEDITFVAQKIFAPNCSKTINSGDICSDLKGLVAQLSEVAVMSNGWDIIPQEITIGKIGDTISNLISVLYELHSDKLGRYRTAVMLTLNDKQLICSIDEVVEQL